MKITRLNNMNMKLKNFLMGLLGAAAFTACSSDTPFDKPVDDPGMADGENYISVAFEMPATAASRTTTNDGLYDDGKPEESKVNNIVFFFFDDHDNCIDVQLINNPTFQTPAEPSMNPNITNYGSVEVRLKAGVTYRKIGVAINSPAENATQLKSEIRNVSDFLERTYDYVRKVSDSGSGQVMSNSIYFNMENGETKPLADKKVDVIEITDDNIYSTAEKKDIDNLIAQGKKKYVEIYVERVLARIDVTANLNLSDYYVIEENGTKKKTVTLYDYVNGTAKDITIKPVVMGIALNVLTPRTALVKPLNIDEVGYGIGTDNDYKNFRWNDPKNKRSYWASTALPDKMDMKYYSWNDAKNKGNAGFTEYVHPNTQDFQPVTDNEEHSLNTKVMVVAKLHKYEGDDDKGPVNLVMVGSDYMLASDFMAHAANLVNRNILNIDWNTQNTGDITLTDEQKVQVAQAVYKTFKDGGYKSDDFQLGIDNADEDWTAVVTLKDDVSTPAIGIDANLLATVTATIKNSVKATLDELNSRRIMYWKDGMTYFYTNIRHQGFDGLVGTGKSFLYGVVRNHIYKVNLTGVYGLGTPVIDPALPIDPNRPDDKRPSYIKAKINILPWRVVVNNATIH